jgi:hypothetical protein
MEVDIADKYKLLIKSWWLVYIIAFISWSGIYLSFHKRKNMLEIVL